jgi:hypothetical protein
MGAARRPLAAVLAFALAAVFGVAILLLDSGHEEADLPARPVDGMRTERPAQLVPLAEGVEVTPILSTGDLVGGYQMSGTPDGLGAFRSGGQRRGGSPSIQVLMNHELLGRAPAGVGARVSRLTLDADDLSPIDASYPLDGREGFLAFCSSTLARIGGRFLYFTGEESIRDGALTTDPEDGLGRGGTSIVLEVDTGRYTETPHFGLMQHENVVPVQGLREAVLLITEDGLPGSSQLYAYIAPDFRRAISGAAGSLYVWRPDGGQDVDANPSTDDMARGETLSGRFVPINRQENSDAEALEQATRARGGFDFARLEDAAVGRARPGELYVTETGAFGSESQRGRLYRLRLDPDDARRAELTLLVDGDQQAAAGAPLTMLNPDNVDTSARSVVIQEDRALEHRGSEEEGGYSRVLVYDIASGRLRAVARVATPPSLEPGEWESSGITNAFDLLGEHTWLLDVQAHGQIASQPGPDLEPGSSSGEDGQLLAIRIPGS